MIPHEFYMKRCLELAAKWAGFTAPNPMVGAVLVYQDRIIGEGAHEYYGGPHAEVNCIRSVAESDTSLIPESTLYVSLEPCAHYGKTPPCTRLILQHNIPKVVIGCRDPFEAVNGKGIEQLTTAGTELVIGVLEKEARTLNAPFFCYHQNKRPYIILKWAQTANGIMAANKKEERLLISSEASNRLVHKWRKESAGILIGTQTALLDDPALNNRYWPGPSPVKIVLDLNDRLPETLRLFQTGTQLIITGKQKKPSGNISYITVDPEKDWMQEMLISLYERSIQSVLVEGGIQTLQSFLNRGLWDEARIITNTEMQTAGLKAPEKPMGSKVSEERIGADRIDYYINEKSNDA